LVNGLGGRRFLIITIGFGNIIDKVIVIKYVLIINHFLN
jgi:hypothetical protein